jgi:hypothetical protein
MNGNLPPLHPLPLFPLIAGLMTNRDHTQNLRSVDQTEVARGFGLIPG